ncbi:MAG: hypothetical protein V1894_05630 [Chloroflexota bacterium]
MGNPCLPKLKVKYFANGKFETDFVDLEGIKKYIDALHEPMIIVEGQVRNSYNELVQLVNQSQYKDKELPEVVLLAFIDGG